MKNVLKATGIISVVLMFLTTGYAFPGARSAGRDDYTCTVTVKYNDGSIAASVKVTTEVSGGIYCVGGRAFYTTKNG